MSEFRSSFESLALIPGSGGCFEVKADDELIFSKLKEGRFPEHEEVKSAIKDRI